MSKYCDYWLTILGFVFDGMQVKLVFILKVSGKFSLEILCLSRNFVFENAYLMASGRGILGKIAAAIE